MNAGDLRDRITIQSPTVTELPGGSTKIEYADLPNGSGLVWASVRQASAMEQIRNDIVSDTATFAIRMRYRDDVTAKNQLIYNGRILSISSVVVFGNKEALDIVATEGTP